MYVVDRALRATFPGDYDKRCLYSAFATCTLIQDAGYSASIVGGRFLAFVVSETGDRAGLQGFGGDLDQLDPPSHFWVEAEGRILDLGPRYLSRGSSFPTAPIPMVAWNPPDGLPKYLRYQASIRYAPDVELLSNFEISNRKEAFVADCRRRYRSQVGQPKLSTWLLTDEGAVVGAASRGDLWALNALKFAERVNLGELPF